MLVDNDTYKKRIGICHKCPHYKIATRSCGTLLLGDEVKHGRGTTKLCGCVIKVKARLKIARCPINKWRRDLTKKQVEDLENAINAIGNHREQTTREQINTFYEARNAITQDQKVYNKCKPCFQNEFNEMVTFLKNKT